MTKITISLDDEDWSYLIKILNRIHIEAETEQNQYSIEIIERITNQLIDKLI